MFTIYIYIYDLIYFILYHSQWSEINKAGMLTPDHFDNISVISWRSVLLVEETGVPKENHRPVASHRQTLSHNVASSTPRLSGFELTTLVVIGTD
jgi:hypothetical protein